MSDFVIENGVLTQYTGPGGDVVIPEGVTTLGDSAFWDCSEVKSVLIPQSVSKIEGSVFRHCKKLRKISFPDHLESIGMWALDDTPWYKKQEGLVIVGGNLIGLNKMNDAAVIVIPDGITGICAGAFSEKLTAERVEIPASVTFISPAAFRWCKCLRELVIAEDNPAYAVQDHILYTKDFATLVYCLKTNSQDIVLPDGLREITGSAFMGCEGISGITFPETLRVVGNSVFYGCKGIADIKLPEGVQHIGSGAFSNCTALKKVQIPSTVETLEKGAFSGCTAITELYNASSCTLFFHNPTGVLYQDIHYLRSSKNDRLPEIRSGYMPHENFQQLLTEEKEVAVNCYLSTWSQYPPEQQAVYTAYVRKQVGRLLTLYMKKGWPELIRAALEIGKPSAAVMKKALEQANGNVEMTAILMDYQNGNVDMAAHEEKEQKKAVREIISGQPSTETLKKLWGTKKLPDGTLMISSYKGEEEIVEVPEKIGKNTVTAIGRHAFSPEIQSACSNREWRHNGIKQIVLPDSVAKIERCAFEGCHSLEKMKLPSSLTIIPDRMCYACSKLTEVRFPENVVQIEEWAFNGCGSLSQVSLPATVTMIGYRAFNCTKLKDFAILNSETVFGKMSVSALFAMTIHAPAGSTAEAYAKENNIPFKAI